MHWAFDFSKTTRTTVPFIELWPIAVSRLSHQEESILSARIVKLEELCYT